MKHFFNDALTIYLETTKDEYGRESWGGGLAVNGRFVESSKSLRNSKGEIINVDALAHLPADTNIAIGSKVVFNGSNYKAIKIDKPKDGVGVRFLKVYLEVYL
jgi:hypothetical protein